MSNSITTIIVCALIAWTIVAIVILGPMVGKALKTRRLSFETAQQSNDDIIFETVKAGRSDFS